MKSAFSAALLLSISLAASFAMPVSAASNDGVASITVDPVGCTLVTVHFKAAATNAGTMGFLWNTI